MLKVEIISAKPRVTKGEQVVVDVEAALYPEVDGDPNGGIRIPNITFEVRTSVGNAIGISSDKGLFEVKDVLISEGEEGTQVAEKVEVEAHYTEKDEVKRAIAEVMVDISDQLALIYGIKQKRKEEEAARLSKEEAARRAKEAEAERERLKREMYEKQEPDRKRQIKADIEKAGEDIINRERFQEAPFNVLREHSDHPNTERVAMNVAAKSPERTIQGVEIYKSATWASKVMEIAAEEKPLTAIKMIAKYKDMDWAPEILKIAAKRHPHEVVKALSQYCEYEWCKDLIMHIAETEPQAAFEEVKMWEFYPWAEEAATVAANKNPAFAINNFPTYQDQPWAQRIYERVVGSGGFVSAEKAEAQRLLKKKITETGTRLLTKPTDEDFAILYEHRFHPHSKVMMTRVAEGSSDACIKAAKIYKSAPWAKEMILLATTKSPETSINELDQYIEMEWAVDVMEKAGNLKPKEAIQALPKYARYIWSKSVIESIAYGSPDSIFEGMEFIEYQPWAEEVVKVAADFKPKTAVMLASGYETQPWAARIKGPAEEKKRAIERAKEEVRIAAVEAIVRAEAKESERLAFNEAAKWTKEALMVRADGGDYTIFRDFSKFGFQSWAGDIIERVASVDPGSAVSYFSRYKGKPWARRVFENLVRTFPENVFKSFANGNLDGHEDIPDWAIGLYLEAVSRAPNLIFEPLALPRQSSLRIRVFAKIMEVDPDIVIRYYYEYPRYGLSSDNDERDEIRQLFVTRFPHLISRLSEDTDDTREVVGMLRERDPFSWPSVKQFFRDLFK